jgi:hypothetical protein
VSVRSGTITLPPPATAAGRAQRDSRDRLVHVCATHSFMPQSEAACDAGHGCVSFCGRDLSHLPLLPPGDYGSRECVVCFDLWKSA